MKMYMMRKEGLGSGVKAMLTHMIKEKIIRQTDGGSQADNAIAKSQGTSRIPAKTCQ